MAAGDERLAEIGIGHDAALVEDEHRHVESGRRVRVDEADVLALQVFQRFIRAFGEHIEYRIISPGAVAVGINGEGFGLHADQTGAREGCGYESCDMDVSGPLSFDHGGIVGSNPYRYFHTELA